MIFIKKIYVKVVSLILIFTFIFILASCDNSSEAYIYFEMPEIPQTLDPQLASTDSEQMIVKNIHEGLLRKNQKGQIVCAIAECFKKEGLRYTFKLRKNAKWSNGEQITAEDFVFAFKRGINPQLKAPLASRLFSIMNAKEIYNGVKSPEELGIKALNDYTLQITLMQNDIDFEETLTTSIAMPCNKKFFDNTKGKYGLSSDAILGSGSYKLSKWSKEVFGIRLYKNKEYNGFAKPKNSAVFINGLKEDETTLQRLEKETTDISFIDCSLTQKAKSKGIKTKEFQNICWVLTISNEFSENIRKSFAMTIGNETIFNNMPVGYNVATSLFPNCITDTATSSGMTAYNLQSGKDLFFREVLNFEDKKFPTDVVLYYYDDGHIKDIVTNIVGHWQGQLSAFVNIEAVSAPELLIEQLKNPSYKMSIFPVRADSNNIAEYLMKFNYSYNNENLSQVQKNILKSNNVIPIAFQNTVIAYSSNLENVNAEFGNGYIDFSFIVKNN